MEKLEHIKLPVENVLSEPFSKNGVPIKRNIPVRPDRYGHAQRLKEQVNDIQKEVSTGLVYSIKFEGQAGKELLSDNLDLSSLNMELLSVKEDNGIISANVKVDSQETFTELLLLLDKYGATSKETSMPYISSIENIKTTEVEDFFTDDQLLFPQSDIKIWWEIYITNDTERNNDLLQQKVSAFRTLIEQYDFISISDNELVFEDRIVFLCYATKNELTTLKANCDYIAEIRIAKKIDIPILDLTSDQSDDLLNELLAKTTYSNNSNCRIVVLDGNTIVRHSLIDNAIIRNQKALEIFDTNNRNGHATEMAGLVLLGDITEAKNLPSIVVDHKVEGVQVFDQLGNPKELWGIITKKAVEITSDSPASSYIMPITEIYGDKHKGKPSTWSGAVDSISFISRKLFAISIGNFSDMKKSSDYKKLQFASCIQSPAQAWNALSIGSYTNLCDATLSAPYIPFASYGDISPHSRTSVSFEKQWPIKPDVLFEGGNRIIDSSDISLDIKEAAKKIK